MCTGYQFRVPLHHRRHFAQVCGGILANPMQALNTQTGHHRLSVLVLHTRRHAALATLLFIVNPASVFMTVPYTEALFAMLSFAGMLCWKRAATDAIRGYHVAAAILFALATALRSNGSENTRK